MAEIKVSTLVFVCQSELNELVTELSKFVYADSVFGSSVLKKLGTVENRRMASVAQ